MNLSTNPLAQSPTDLPPPPKEKTSNRKYVWFFIAIILIVIIIVAAFVFFGRTPVANGTQITFTEVNEHLVIYSHTASGDDTTQNTLPLNRRLPFLIWLDRLSIPNPKSACA
jgi:hypothetical protein